MRLASLTLAALLGFAALPALAQTPGAAPGAAPAATSTTPPTASHAAAPKKAAAVPSGAPVNVNTASASELDAIPQIGPKRAAAIIAHRPYKTADELVTKKALSQGIYDKIKARVTAS